MEWPTMSISSTEICDKTLSIFRWIRKAEERMSRLFTAPKLNEKTLKPSSTKRLSRGNMDPRVPKKPWISRTGGFSSVAVPKSSRRLIRLPRTRFRMYLIPSVPPDRSCATTLVRPSQRDGAWLSQRRNQRLFFVRLKLL